MGTEPEGMDRENDEASARREFLHKVGKFAAVTPPVMATMLTVMAKPALASGSGARGGKGDGWAKGRGKGDARRKGDGWVGDRVKGPSRSADRDSCVSDQATVSLSSTAERPCD